MSAPCYRFPLGDFECVSLLDGSMDYKLESMVKNAPRSDVAAALQAHAMPTDVITTPYAYLFAGAGQHGILVDMGAGNLAPTTGRLVESMRAAGLTPQDIDTVFITHAHPDHVGGALDGEGQLVFANATYFIGKLEWDYWFSHEATTRSGEGMTSIARGRLTALRAKVVLLEQAAEILPGVSVLFAPGHTPGHMVVSVESRGDRLLYTGDTVLHPLHLEHPDWLPIYDLLPELAAASKHRIFDLAAATGCWVLGQHFPPFPNLGHVVRKEIGWEWQPVAIDRPK